MAGPPGGVAGGRMNGWRAVVRVLRSPVDDLVTTVFPADCRCCEGPLLRASAVPVCDVCVGRVRIRELPGCGRCGEALDLDQDMEDVRFAGMFSEGLLCRECRMAEPPFARLVSYGTHDDELRELIKLLKFGGVQGVARLLGPRLGEAILQLEGQAAEALLVAAVPLYVDRERQRGYNQSRLLADEALRWLRRARPDWRLSAAHGVIARVRHTESSYTLSRVGRRRNLRGAFRMQGDVAGREVLLVDDIYTSGATARECARVLLRAGAAKVWVATVARAQRRMVQRQHEDAGTFTASWDLGATTTTEEA